MIHCILLSVFLFLLNCNNNKYRFNNKTINLYLSSYEIDEGSVEELIVYLREKIDFEAAIELGWDIISIDYVIKALKEKGCDINKLYLDDSGLNLIQYICGKGSYDFQVEFVSMLIENGFDVNATSRDGLSNLLFYYFNRNNSNGSSIKIVDKLLLNNSDILQKNIGYSLLYKTRGCGYRVENPSIRDVIIRDKENIEWGIEVDPFAIGMMEIIKKRRRLLL